jgi:hypothetical protein
VFVYKEEKSMNVASLEVELLMPTFETRAERLHLGGGTATAAATDNCAVLLKSHMESGMLLG